MDTDFSSLHEGRLVITDRKNPFDVVKATDLSDSQIADYFVDFPEGGTLLQRVKPTSPMPMLIFGGKGSGKTHLMRYLAYPLQLRRHGTRTAAREKIPLDGYIGIYFRCGGLNAQRFSGKGQSDELWHTAFSYYMELWFGQLVLATVRDLYADTPEALEQPELVTQLLELFDDRPPGEACSTIAIVNYLQGLQREADIAINNCVITRQLDIRIGVTVGRLVFGIPQCLARYLPGLSTVSFLYLVDEYENLTEAQQRYINTLIRERQSPVTFKVGVRLYGQWTKETLAAGEENREDSEYEALRLDVELRNRPDEAQLTFAANLVRNRLVQAGYLTPAAAMHFQVAECFENGGHERLHAPDTAHLVERYRDREPPYIGTLRQKIQAAKNEAPGIRSRKDIDDVISALRLPDFPLLERTNVFLLYRAWSRKIDLRKAAREICQSATEYIGGAADTAHAEVLRYFRSDVTAQLYRDTKQPQRYVGFSSFVRMSAGLPRGLLTILKYVFTWALFFGEQPFIVGRISPKAQNEGVAQAAEWFFADARAPGELGTAVRDAMTRLGQVLRDIRFSDKPSECSLCTFSADLTTASARAVRTLNEASNWSMLIHIRSGQHDRNDGRVDEKYQVHPMLAPRWDLPISRRGAIALTGEEVTAIFDPPNKAAFEQVLNRRVAAMMAPFAAQAGANASKQQASLPGLYDE